MSSSETAPTGRERLRARVVERCERCRTERAVGSTTACRCSEPAWRPFCSRCAKAFDPSSTDGLCPTCLETARTNGAKLRATLETRLARDGGLSGAIAASARLEIRAANTLAQFGLAGVVPALPAFAEKLADPSAPLPLGASASRAKMAAISELRLEATSVRLALEKLGYLGQPVETKLARVVADTAAAARRLARWADPSDSLAADGAHEGELREAAEALAGGLTAATPLLDSVKNRDLSRLVEAVVRRDRAVRQCGTALGVA
ncbi:MAG: hypothetical protein LW806_11135 [Planctomycetaceae bacterium]|nr:hypothetical protein [Planctomycetaceae bacterium]